MSNFSQCAMSIRSATTGITFLILLCPTLARSQWVQTNGPYGGSVYCFAKSDTNLFVGAPFGVYCSTDGGSTWASASWGLTGGNVTHLLWSARISSREPLRCIRSTNNGASWISAGLAPRPVDAFAVGPAAGGTGVTNLFAVLIFMTPVSFFPPIMVQTGHDPARPATSLPSQWLTRISSQEPMAVFSVLPIMAQAGCRPVCRAFGSKPLL